MNWPIYEDKARIINDLLDPDAEALRDMAAWLSDGGREIDISCVRDPSRPRWAISFQTLFPSYLSGLANGDTIGEAWAALKASEGFPK